MVRTLVANASYHGSIPVNCCRDLVKWTLVRKLMSSASIWGTGCPKLSLTYQIPTWSIDLIFCAAPKHFLPSASHDHGSGSGILRRFCFPLPANEDVLESSRPPLLNMLSRDWSADYCGHPQDHFLSSINRRYQP